MGYSVISRGNRFYYYKRVPKKIAHLDRRRFIKISLETSDKSEALERAPIYHARVEEFWAALFNTGNAAGAEEKFKGAVDLARLMGFKYKITEEVAKLPLPEILARLEAAHNEVTIDALLGGIDPPKITLFSVPDKYFELAVDVSAGQSERWIKKWKTDRTSAMNHMIVACGNKAISELERQDTLKLQEYWGKKIKDGRNGDTANKNIRYCREMIERVALANEVRINYRELFSDLRFQVKTNSRPPFEADYVRDIMLPRIDCLPYECMLAFLVVADTGIRPSEYFRLLQRPDDIRLDANIPFIWIRGKKKTDSSERQIPLVGTALYAFKKKPKLVWTNEDSLTNVMGQYLKEYGLLPTERHSFYSLRHTMKDRLRDIEAPAEIIDEIMGHEDEKPKYGRGHLLEKKHKWLSQIAFSVSKLKAA